MNTNESIIDSSLIMAAKDQISSDLAGEAVILALRSGKYYGLNEVGASVWKLIQEPKTVNQVREALLEEYEVEPEICDRDLFDLLQELQSVGLIEVTP